MILVVAGALYLDGRSIEQEAAIASELDGANAEGCFVTIDCLTIDLHFGEQFVKTAFFQRPEPRSIQVNLLAKIMLISDRSYWPRDVMSLPTIEPDGSMIVETTRTLFCVAPSF